MAIVSYRHPSVLQQSKRRYYLHSTQHTRKAALKPTQRVLLHHHMKEFCIPKKVTQLHMRPLRVQGLTAPFPQPVLCKLPKR